MSAPMCGGCGKARALIRPNAIRNPHSRAAMRRKTVAMRDHALCRRCWRALIEPILVAQHALTLALSRGERVAGGRVREEADRVA